MLAMTDHRSTGGKKAQYGCKNERKDQLDPERDSGIDTASFLASLATNIPVEEVMEALGNDPLGYFYQHQLGITTIDKLKEKNAK